MSMKNQDTWDFAQRHSGKIWAYGGMIQFAVFMLVILACFRLPSFETIVTVLFFVELIPLVLSIWPTERALRKQFDSLGNRKEE